MTRPPVRYLAQVVALTAVYLLAGRFGLAMDAVSGFASLVWPPAGIALAALLLWGPALWPGVAVGALLVNLWAGAPLLVAAGIATGNTVEALLGSWALRRIPGFRPSLERLRDVLGLVLLAAALSTTLSATVGVLSLFLGRIISVEQLSLTWSAWWMGDALGDLVVAPLVLVWASHPAVRPEPRNLQELAALAVALLGAGLFVFASAPTGPTEAFLQPYLLAPPLLWAALRFHQRGAVSGLFLVAVLAVAGTSLGLGPFHTGTLLERLRGLQAFITLLAPTLMVLAAVTVERTRAERELRSARDAAEAASRAKSNFLAVMSHELRTPLTGIIGYADLMGDGIAGPLTPKQAEYVARQKRAAWHLIGLIEGVLTFSRAEAGKDEARPELLDAVELARDVVSLLEPQAAAKGLRLHLEAPECPLHLVTDAGKLRQVLVNLVGNAVKFSSRGEVSVTVARQEPWMVFRVRDQGPGIGQEQLERIFEPFTQVADPGTREHGGIGLGLSVSRTFARMLGGGIEVETSPGEGSSFTLRLPATPALVPGSDEAPAQEAPQRTLDATKV